MSDETAPPEGGSAAVPEPAPKMVSAEDVERIVAERVNKSKAQFKDYPELKAKAEQFEKLQAEHQTDVEKAISRAEKAEAKARAESQQREDLVRQLHENTVRTEVFRSAATAEIGLEVDDVYRLIDRDSVTIDEGGEVSGVAEAIQKLAEKYPKRSAPGGFDGGPRQVSRERSSTADFNARLRREAGFA